MSCSHFILRSRTGEGKTKVGHGNVGTLRHCCVLKNKVINNTCGIQLSGNGAQRTVTVSTRGDVIRALIPVVRVVISEDVMHFAASLSRLDL